MFYALIAGAMDFRGLETPVALLEMTIADVAAKREPMISKTPTRRLFSEEAKELLAKMLTASSSKRIPAQAHPGASTSAVLNISKIENIFSQLWVHQGNINKFRLSQAIHTWLS